MRVEMLKTNEEQLEAEYEDFRVGDEAMHYQLTVSGFNGKYGTFYPFILKQHDKEKRLGK